MKVSTSVSIAIVTVVAMSCAPIEYSVVIVEASQAVAEAEVAGASCTQDQLDRLSPLTENMTLDPGTEIATSEETQGPVSGEPMCDAPYEYYSALEYLRKAREEVGYSDYEAAVEFARTARTFAVEARDISIRRGRERGR